MTEQGIFEILLQNNVFSNENKNHIYPTLIPDAANDISGKLTDIIYDSLKSKSLTSVSKRANLLKFLQNISSRCNKHNYVDEDNCSCVLKHFENSYKKNDEAEEFLKKCDQEVKKNKLKLYEKIINVQKARNIKQNALNIQRDFKLDRIQKKLGNLGIVCDFALSETLYHPNENTIKKIFKVDDKRQEIEDYIVPVEDEKFSKDYRLKQIKFGYAVINVGTESEVEKFLILILHNLSKYEKLYDFERPFLKFLFKNIGIIANYNNFCDQFFFILEIDIIEICTQVVKLKDANEVQEFFHSLSESEEFLYIRGVCNKNTNIFRKIKNVLYTLYGHSFCNINILRLMKLLY